MAPMRTLSIELPEGMAEHLENWATFANITISQAVVFFVCLGINILLHSNESGYLSLFNQIMTELEEKEVTYGREL